MAERKGGEEKETRSGIGGIAVQTTLTSKSSVAILKDHLSCSTWSNFSILNFLSRLHSMEMKGWSWTLTGKLEIELTRQKDWRRDQGKGKPFMNPLMVRPLDGRGGLDVDCGGGEGKGEGWHWQVQSALRFSPLLQTVRQSARLPQPRPSLMITTWPKVLIDMLPYRMGSCGASLIHLVWKLLVCCLDKEQLIL